MDESDNVINSKLDVNSILSQRDLIEALHNLSPTLAFSKTTVLAALAAITEIKGWKLERRLCDRSHAQKLGRKAEEHVPSRLAGCVVLLMCFHTIGSDFVPA